MKRAHTLLLIIGLVCPAPASAALKPGDFVTSGPAKDKRIALSFDDGPGPNTEKFLDLLQRYNVKATFFVLGDQVRIRPEVAKRIVRDGHEIASHTMTHINYNVRFRHWLKQSGGEPGRDKAVAAVKADLIKDMEESRRVIEKTTGAKLKILRMPHGIDKPWIKDAARAAGFVLVNWTYGADWTSPPPDPIESLKKSYVKSLQPGAIILLHDGWPRSDKSLAVTEALLKGAKEKDCELVTVGALLGVN